MKSKLDNSWDDFFEQFMLTLLADGYDEFEILEKFMDVFKGIRNGRTAESPKIDTPTTEESTFTSKIIATTKDVSETTSIDKLLTRKKSKHIPPKEHTNYDKTLHTKFEHALVYVLGAKDERLATIERGPNERVKDVYKLVSTGEEFNEHNYLKTFNPYFNPDNADEWKWRNKARIVFYANPNCSIAAVKSNSHYYKLNSIEDIKNFVPNKRKDI